MSIAYNTKCFTSYFPAFCGDFVPCSLVHFIAAISYLASKGDNFANDKFRDRSRICERRVKDADSMLSSVLEVNLVRADAEAADHDEILCCGENSSSKLGLAADTKNVNVSKRLSDHIPMFQGVLLT